MTQIKVGDKVGWAKFPGETFTVAHTYPDKNLADIINKLGGQYTAYYDELTVLTDTPELKPGMMVVTKDGKRTYTFVDYDGEYLSCDDETGHQYFFKRDQIEPVDFEPTMIIEQPQDNVKEQQELLDRFIQSALHGFCSDPTIIKVEKIPEMAMNAAKAMLDLRNQNLVT